MKIIHTSVEEMAMRRLLIGFEGENQRATVRIDCASVFTEYPNATPALIVKPLFADAYPVVVDRNGTDVDWLITSEILSFTGDGEIQLTFVKDQVICKSAIAKIRVCRSLTVTGDMPDPVAQWVDDANAKLAEVDAQIVELEGMVDTATDAATRAEQSESNATTAATNAATSAATATAKATEATNAAGTATAKAAEAQTAAQTATEKANAAAESERIATAKAGDATTAAGTATTKATEATEAAQTATEKAGDASASATAAQASATNAASSATAASASETAAKASETAASTSASQAGTSAQNAGTAAQTATQKAAEATQSATNAAASATSAATSAETASTKAGEAAQSAQAVAETAEQLADSLEQIGQNTQDIAELDERKANIDGYYPDMTVGNAEQLNSSKYVENSEPYTFRTSGGTSDIGNREYLDAVVGGTVAWNQAVRDEASENSTDFADVVTVTDAVEDAAGVKVKLEPAQDLHGYDHPWPAGGGKNLIPENGAGWYSPYGSISSTFADGVWTITNAHSTGRSGRLNVGTLPAGTYYVKYGTASTTSSVFVNKVSDDTRIANITKNTQQSFTLAEDTEIYVGVASFDVGSANKIVNLMLSTSQDEYSPYSNICPITGWDGVQIVVSPTTDAEDGQTYDITLPTEAGTVYGGTLDVSTGELVVDRASVDIGTFDWTTYSSADRHIFRAPYPNPTPYIASGTSLPHALCSSYYPMAYNPISASDNGAFSFGAGRFVVIDHRFTDATLFGASVSGVQLVYELATPITYTLTAPEIRTLLGTNNVWADTGDLALTYTGTDEHLTLESGKKYLSRISGTDSMLLGSGQEITAVKGTDNVFDLTQMFGTAVADYVYGQGASFFRRWFGKQWYPYNAGELRHVEGLSAHEMVGFNQWDEEWEIGGIDYTTGENTVFPSYSRSKNYIAIIPSLSYYFKKPQGVVTYLFFYDCDKNFISRTDPFATAGAGGTFAIPSNAYFMRFSNYRNTYKHDICINLAHNNSRNGEYEPYEKHSYPLDSTVVLRGIPKVGANGVYWDGDRYLPDGTVERKYGVVDLGTLSWSYQDANTRFFTDGIKNLVYKGSGDWSAPFVCSKYKAIIWSSTEDKFVTLSNTNGRLWIKDTDYTDASAFKASLQGVMLVYELATPTTETAQPYHSTQWVSDWGTEEFVSTGLVPVGHETRYPANLRDKLQHLPDAASGNGSYLITQTDGQMVLTPFPAPPSTAGNYVLKATVVNGVATYTWEVAT